MSHDFPTIRPATNADAPAVRELIFTILREFNLPPDPDGTDADLKDIEAAYFKRGGRFDVMIDLHQQIIGSVGLFRTDDQAVELRKMYVAASARGRGLGRRLLDHAVAEARRLGCRRITLETASQLTTAIAMYKRYGFRASDGMIHVSRCDQAYEMQL
jgi:putative acetyltransferase